MRRRLFTLASALSFLLCLATQVLWVRSYWISDQCARRTRDARTQLQGFQSLQTWRGSINWTLAVLDGSPIWNREYDSNGRLARVEPAKPLAPTTRPLPFEWTYLSPPVITNTPLHTPSKSAIGVGWTKTTCVGTVEASDNTQTLRTGTLKNAAIPLYAFAIFFAVWPLLWSAAIIRRAKRMRRGLCPRCSYNLTGNASGVCPECGTPISPSTATFKDKSPRRA